MGASNAKGSYQRNVGLSGDCRGGVSGVGEVMEPGEGKRFLRRKSDGKFYRGAKLWRWTRFWGFAAVLPKRFLASEIFVNHLRKHFKGEYDLVTLDEIDTD